LKAGRNKTIRRKSLSTPTTAVVPRTPAAPSSSSSSSSLSATEDLVFRRNLDQATEGLNDYVRKHLLEKISQENASIIVDYILAMHAEMRLSDNYRLNTIVTLKCLAEPVRTEQEEEGHLAPPVCNI
jgi:hypothetical protein